MFIVTINAESTNFLTSQFAWDAYEKAVCAGKIACIAEEGQILASFSGVTRKKCNVEKVGKRLLVPRESNATKTPLWGDVYSNGAVGIAPESRDDLVPSLRLTNGGNDKTGKEMQSVSTDIIDSCDHSAPCFQSKEEVNKDGGLNLGKADCYACTGFHQVYPANIIQRWENTAALRRWSTEQCAQTLDDALNKATTEVRWQESGDFIPQSLKVSVDWAYSREAIDFYGYTKKDRMWNTFIREHGGSIAKAMPKNLHVLFSRWDTDYFHTDNPFGFPEYRYVPLGQEHNIRIREGIDLVCPCSNPNWAGTCIDCGRCSHVQPGQIIYGFEHSTSRTKKRDDMNHASQKVLKEQRKELQNDLKNTTKALTRAKKAKVKDENVIKALALEVTLAKIALDKFESEHIKPFI